MYEDMSQSGLKYAQDEMGQHAKGKRNGSDRRWGHGDELLLHCIDAALESGRYFVFLDRHLCICVPGQEGKNHVGLLWCR